jgi:peptide/nickel transport system substrate-binding protein
VNRDKDLQELFFAWQDGKVSRSSFLKAACALGLSLSAASLALELGGDVAGAEPLAAQGMVVAGPQGNGRGGTMIVGQESDMDVLDPCLGTGAVTWRAVLYQVYESLVSRELNNPRGLTGQLIPGITRSWQMSPDGKTYTFHLQKGIRFTDGTPFDAQAVVWNVERQWDQSTLGRKNAPQFDTTAAAVRQWFWAPADLREIKILDSHTLEFRLGHPFSQFVQGMIESGLGTMGMSSPTVWKKYGTKGIAQHPVGTGPFLFHDRVIGDHVTIVRNPHYWNPAKAAKLDSIIFKVLPDPAVRVNALRSGNVHVIFAPPPTELASLQQAGFIVTARINTHLWYLSLNALEPYWKDQRVRAAFFMSIDRAGMAKNLLKNTALPAVNMTGRTCPIYPHDVTYPAYNPTRAKQLLAEAGYKNGFSTVFQIPTSGSGEMIPVPMAEWIANDAKKIGINVKLETMEWITYLHAWGAGLKPGIGLNQQSWGMATPYWLNLPLRSTSVFNVGHAKIPGVDHALDLANGSLNTQEAVRHYINADALNGQALWSLPIVNDLAPVVISPKVMNFVHSPDWWWDFRNVWMKS